MTSTTPPRKNILFVTRPLGPPWDEASKNFAHDLALHATAHDITVLTDRVTSPQPPHLTQKRVYSANRFSLWQKARLVAWLWRNAAAYTTVHLLFTPTPLSSAILRRVCRRTGVRVVQTVATVRDDLYTTSQMRAMFFGDAVVTYSAWGAQKLRQIGLANVQHIYPGIDAKRFFPAPKDSALLRRFRIAPTDIVVTYPGEFTRLGATDTIIDAFARLWNDTRNHHIRYVCACRVKNDADARKKRDVIARLERMGQRDRVIFTDTFDDMNAIYNLSDIVIFPVASMHGKFDVPLAMVEPYMCEKPVIASSLPLFAEFSNPAINVIIPASHARALSDAIAELARDGERRATLGKNAAAFARHTFNINTTAHAYEQLYDHT